MKNTITMQSSNSQSTPSFTVATEKDGNVTVLVAQLEEISQHGSGTRLIVNGKEFFSPESINDVQDKMNSAS